MLASYRSILLVAMLLSLLLDQLGHQPGPAGLVAGAQPGARLAVEVLVEQHQVAPAGVALQGLVPPGEGAPPRLIREEEADQAPGEDVGDPV
jgi:hypothetical protein